MPPEPTRAAPRPHSAGLARRGGIGTRHLLLAALALMALLPLAGLGLWVHVHAAASLRLMTAERDRMVARDLAIEMSDHIEHARTAFAAELLLAPPAANAPAGPALPASPALAALRAGLDLRAVCLLPAPGQLVQAGPCDLAPAALARLRQAAPPPGARPLLIEPVQADAPPPADDFHLIAGLPDGRIAVAVLGPGHMRWLARPVLARGPALVALLDAQGRALLTPEATPPAPALATAIAALSGVADRQSGLSRDGTVMIARAVVPDTGWQVVVAEPLGSVGPLGRSTLAALFAMGAVGLLLAMALAGLLGQVLVRPLAAMATTARAVLAGDETAAVPVPSGFVPRELRLLGRAMNSMLATLRRRAGETQAALAEARAASAAKTVFLTTMSHEIRTPLHGVLGSLELLDRTSLDPQQRQRLEGAAQSGRRLSRLVDAVFDMARLESGQLVLQEAPFRLAGLIADLSAEAAPQAEARGLRFLTHLPAHLDIAVIGDAARLRQILSNLLENAVKFTASGGVTLGVTSLAETSRAISLRISVADTGIGIAAERQAGLFTPFAPGDTSLTRRQDGAGLGLAIARALAMRMGATLGLDSTTGGGSVFWLTLNLAKAVLEPLDPPQPGAAAAGEASPESADPGCTQANAARPGGAVLLVEDNAANRRIALAMLETLGCTVTLAENGREGVEAWRGGQFDLVLMDCQMPDMDGLAATRAIRRLEVLGERPRTPILALTANSEEDSRDACLEVGMDTVLTKPLTLAGLRDALVANRARTAPAI